MPKHKSEAAPTEAAPTAGKKLKNEAGSASASGSTDVKAANEFLSAAAGVHTSNIKCCNGHAIDNANCHLEYHSGFGAEHSSQALPGVILPGSITPQKCPYNLIAEQLSGTSFTTPRVFNQRTWFYRIQPTAKHSAYKKIDRGLIRGNFSEGVIKPDQIRWKPFAMPSPSEKLDFVQGLKTLGGAGTPELKTGFALHIYTANVSMVDKAFVNSDGDFLVVPQCGDLYVTTECGKLHVKPNEVMVIPRGHRFSVAISGSAAEPVRGYVCEVFNGHFRIPDLGPIGSNGLANPKDFQVPVAWYENRTCKFTVVQKFLGELFAVEADASCFDAVAWFGNYYPYKYDLAHYIAVNSVTRDHLDPSIFTVLTCPTTEVGVAAIDFVIFPPRWAVQETTFRPPYYHRNCMTEFMGNIRGRYEAKPEGFLPGGASLHSCMAGHGPDSDTYEKASNGGGVDLAALSTPTGAAATATAAAAVEQQKPVRMPDDSMSFMFESTYIMRLTEWGASAPVDTDYWKCWQGLKREFDPKQKLPTSVKAKPATATAAAPAAK